MATWALATAAGALLVYAALSRRFERTWISPPIFFLSTGLLVGGEGLGWIDFGPTNEQVRVLAEVTLTLVLFADASRIDIAALRREYSVPLRLLGIGLPLTIVAGAAVGAALFSSFTFVEIVILAVILAPTDAALGQAVVTDPRLPSRIRQGLNVESGLNDGICVPLLYIALAIAEAESGQRSNHGALVLLVEAIGYGVLFGAIAGIGGGLAARFARQHELIDSAWTQILPVATAALAYGLAAPLGGSGFIAAFVAGFAFGALHRDNEGETTLLLDELGALTNGVTFLVFGALAGTVLAALSWRAALYGVLSLTVVRMLPVAVALWRTHAKPRTVAFVGWFGPRGLASIVFTVIALETGALPHSSAITAAVVFTIVLSVYAHGLSANPLTDRYARWYRAHPEEQRPPMESVHAPDQRWRPTRASLRPAVNEVPGASGVSGPQ